MIDFKLPKELIAQEPAHPRDRARLLVYNRQTKTIVDTIFSEINNFLVANTSIVVNNSKVEQCRWLFNDGKVELFVLEKLDTQTIRAMVRPGRKFKTNTRVSLTEWLYADVVAIDDEGLRTLRLNVHHDDARLIDYEHVPLPPYIAQNDELASEYQTVYSKPLGSKAAPTAGLHFTEPLMQKLKSSHEWLEVTLHVGLGTFAPLTEEHIASNTLHTEHYEITESVATKLTNATHITAIGTTTTRTLESWAQTHELISDTEIFINPGYKFQCVDSMVTNFHLPGTSLLLMVEAFVGNKTEMQRIYDHAITKRYRFYSFGDAMLLI